MCLAAVMLWALQVAVVAAVRGALEGQLEGPLKGWLEGRLLAEGGGAAAFPEIPGLGSPQRLFLKEPLERHGEAGERKEEEKEKWLWKGRIGEVSEKETRNLLLHSHGVYAPFGVLGDPCLYEGPALTVDVCRGAVWQNSINAKAGSEERTGRSDLENAHKNTLKENRTQNSEKNLSDLMQAQAEAQKRQAFPACLTGEFMHAPLAAVLKTLRPAWRPFKNHSESFLSKLSEERLPAVPEKSLSVPVFFVSSLPRLRSTAYLTEQINKAVLAVASSFFSSLPVSFHYAGGISLLSPLPLEVSARRCNSPIRFLRNLKKFLNRLRYHPLNRHHAISKGILVFVDFNGPNPGLKCPAALSFFRGGFTLANAVAFLNTQPEDSIFFTGKKLAHEFGHLLGAPHDSRSGHLMESASCRDCREAPRIFTDASASAIKEYLREKQRRFLPVNATAHSFNFNASGSPAVHKSETPQMIGRFSQGTGREPGGQSPLILMQPPARSFQSPAKASVDFKAFQPPSKFLAVSLPAPVLSKKAAQAFVSAQRRFSFNDIVEARLNGLAPERSEISCYIFMSLGVYIFSLVIAMVYLK